MKVPSVEGKWLMHVPPRDARMQLLEQYASRGAPVRVLLRIQHKGRIKGTNTAHPETVNPQSTRASNIELKGASEPQGRIKSPTALYEHRLPRFNGMQTPRLHPQVSEDRIDHPHHPPMAKGGGFIILAWSKCLNNESTEDKQIVM